MRICSFIIIAVIWLLPIDAMADDRNFRLSAPDVLVDSGLLKHLLPRFSLKTGIRIELVQEGAEVTLVQDAGQAVFIGAGATWRILVVADHAGAARFAEWLASEVGQRTVTSYMVDGISPFTLPGAEALVEDVIRFEGNAQKGAEISARQCGRCHVVNQKNRMNAIGSTPSFFLLRSLGDWDDRFQSFYTLNPHPAFTQIIDVTAPFPAHLPSPIVPVEITQDDLKAILAYVSQLAPANLGAPLAHQ